MKLHEFASWLDHFFEVERFVEVGGWDFALTPEETAGLMRFAFPTFQRTFNGLIGLPELGKVELARVYPLVFPEASLVERVIAEENARERPGALVVTHHPCDMETSGRGFLAIPGQQLERLFEARVGMYVLHAPLDCHAEISTSGALADGLGLRRVGTFAPYVAGEAGVIGEQEPERFGAFAERVRALCELDGFDLEQVRFAGREVRRVAIVAGGGDDVADIAEAERLGSDTFLAGHWWTPHPGEWADGNRARLREAIAVSRMNFLSASHDGSELVVFRDRLAPLFAGKGFEVVLHRQQDHWR